MLCHIYFKRVLKFYGYMMCDTHNCVYAVFEVVERVTKSHRCFGTATYRLWVISSLRVDFGVLG